MLSLLLLRVHITIQEQPRVFQSLFVPVMAQTTGAFALFYCVWLHNALKIAEDNVDNIWQTVNAVHAMGEKLCGHCAPGYQAMMNEAWGFVGNSLRVQLWSAQVHCAEIQRLLIKWEPIARLVAPGWPCFDPMDPEVQRNSAAIFNVQTPINTGVHMPPIIPPIFTPVFVDYVTPLLPPTPLEDTEPDDDGEEAPAAPETAATAGGAAAVSPPFYDVTPEPRRKLKPRNLAQPFNAAEGMP